MRSVLLLSALGSALAANAKIASYEPPTNVVEHNEIDLDQEEIEKELKELEYTKAKTVYAEGKYSTKSSGMRTIKYMSKDLSGEPLFDAAKAYYGDVTYGDTWVSGALTPYKAEYTNGGADFATVNDDSTREQGTKKGSVFMIIFPYAIHELESALNYCGKDETKSLHYLDEGVAFYTGSLVGDDATGATKGKLQFGVAQSRCKDFVTCGSAGAYSTSGLAEANKVVFEKFELFKTAIKAKDCTSLRGLITEITNFGSIPLIQGTLKYAFEIGPDGSKIGDKKYIAEAATFAASILPSVHKCSAADAKTIYDNTKIGGASTDFTAVKAAFERNYECLGVTCANIGGYSKDGVYKAGFGAGCTTTGLSTGALIGIIVGAVAVVALVGVVVFLQLKGKKPKVQKSGGPDVAAVEA